MLIYNLNLRTESSLIIILNTQLIFFLVKHNKKKLKFGLEDKWIYFLYYIISSLNGRMQV
jgi:hypothetical protein